MMNVEVRMKIRSIVFVLHSAFRLLHLFPEGWQSGLSRRGANAESLKQDQRFESSTLR
jgi:hypothetical protein